MRKKVGVFRIGASWKKWDIFGYPIGVTYKGDNYYRTKMGAFFTVFMFIIVISYGSE